MKVSKGKRKKRTGKKTILNKELVQRISNFMSTSVTLKTACLCAGVSASAYSKWIDRGRKDEEKGLTPDESVYVLLLHETTRAKARAEVRLGGIITKAAEKDWRAALAILERRNSKDWAKRNKHELLGEDGGPVEIHIDWPQQVSSTLDDLDNYDDTKLDLDDELELEQPLGDDD